MNVHYNPDLLTDDALRRQFVVRHAALDRLTGALGAATPGHHLIVAPRGMGKTTLLRRLRLALREDPALRARWVPLSFPEEQYNVTRLSDFWANCVDALADALEGDGRAQEARALDAVLDAGADRAFEALLDFSAKEGRGLVLLVDNLDLVLGRIGEADQWELRRVFGATPSLVLIGASANLADESAEYGKPFYEFLLPLSLAALSLDEVRAILRTLGEAAGPEVAAAVARVPEGRLRSLHTLTGGNPRTTGLIFELVAQDDHASAESLLNGLLDRVTPLYKARFEALPDQLQVVLDAVALAWDPAPAAAIAAHTGLVINLASAQLTRLIELGHVEKVRLPGTKKLGFQIAERFFNIWYLMRASRRLRRRLGHLVRFMELLWTPEDRLRIASAFVHTDAELGAALALAQTSGASAEPMMAAAVARALRNAAGSVDDLRYALAEMVEPGPEGLLVRDSIGRETWRRELEATAHERREALAAVGYTAEEAVRALVVARSLWGMELHIDAPLDDWARQLAKVSALRDRLLARMGARAGAALLAAAADPGWGGPEDAVGQRAACVTHRGPWLPIALIAFHPKAGGRDVALLPEEAAQAAAEALADGDLAMLGLLAIVCQIRGMPLPAEVGLALESALPPQWNTAAVAHMRADNRDAAARCAREAVAADPKEGWAWWTLALASPDGDERRRAAEAGLTLTPHEPALRGLALQLTLADRDLAAAGRHAARFHALLTTGQALPAEASRLLRYALALLASPLLDQVLATAAAHESTEAGGEHLVMIAAIRGVSAAPIREALLRHARGPARRRLAKRLDQMEAALEAAFGVATPVSGRLAVLDARLAENSGPDDQARQDQLHLLAAGGHAAAALEWIQTHGLEDQLAPLCHALRIEAAGDTTLLDGLAPEMRIPTQSVLEQIARIRADGGYRWQPNEAFKQAWTEELARIAAEGARPASPDRQT